MFDVGNFRGHFGLTLNFDLGDFHRHSSRKFDVGNFRGHFVLSIVLTLEIPVVILHCIGLISNVEVMMMSLNRFECSVTRATLICLS